MMSETPKTREELLALLKPLADVYGLYIDDSYLDDGPDFCHWLPSSMYATDIEHMLSDVWTAVRAEEEITPITPEEEAFIEADYREHRFDEDEL